MAPMLSQVVITS